jgi:hypothetical protein
MLLDAKNKLAKGESIARPMAEMYPTAYAEPIHYGDMIPFDGDYH